MLAALGFLVATFLWLLILPAISRRAERLARRRAELTFPLSVDEIAAERDHLRAEYAVRHRELERRSEESASARAQAMAKVGTLDIHISELKTTIGVRDINIADLSGRLRDTEADLAETRSRLAAEEAGHAASRSDLAIRGEALVERDRDIAALRVERADLSATLAARIRDLQSATERGEQLSTELSATSAALAALREAHAAALERGEQLDGALQTSNRIAAEQAARIAHLEGDLAAVQTRLAAEQSGHETTRFAFEKRGEDLASLLAEREQLRQRLKASDDALATKTQIVLELQAAKATLIAQDKASRAELETVNAELRQRVADKARLEAAQGSIRREADVRIQALNAELGEAKAKAAAAQAAQTALSKQVSDLQGSAQESKALIDAENAELRKAIIDVGDSFLSRLGAGIADPEPFLASELPPLSSTTGKSAAKAANAGRRTTAKGARVLPDRAAE